MSSVHHFVDAVLRVNVISGFPKLSLAMYPFSNLIDEHVSLNMGAGRIFSRQGPKMDFSGVGQKYFWLAKSGKISFSPLKLRKQHFCKNIYWKMSKFKILGVPCPTSDAYAPKVSYDKVVEENNTQR